jgi:DNA-binding GntR family transcriptional regulator
MSAKKSSPAHEEVPAMNPAEVPAEEALPPSVLALRTAVTGHHATKLARSIYSGQIASHLREAIVSGDLPEGTPLVEGRLAEQLAVSRGPIRSALHALEGEGLVRTMPNGRMQSAGFGQGDLHDLMRVRFELESRGLRWGIERRAVLVQLQKAFVRLRQEGASTRQLVELDLGFHRALVSLSGSRFLVQSWLALAPVIAAVIAIGNRELETRDPTSNFERIVASHRLLVDAVGAYDVEQATQMLADQFQLTASMFEDRPRRDSPG